MSDNIVVQAPAAPTRLILLFHGVGSSPQSMLPLGRQLAARFTQAVVVGVSSPDVSDMGAGWQWFSVRGITEENRPERIAATMPRFVETVVRLQKSFGLVAEQTVLVGFSQGAIMALASTQTQTRLAKDIVAIAGRFAHVPTVAPPLTAVHLIHGDADAVVSCQHSVLASEALTQLGAEVTTDILPGLGHGINDDAVDAVLRAMGQSVGP